MATCERVEGLSMTVIESIESGMWPLVVLYMFVQVYSPCGFVQRSVRTKSSYQLKVGSKPELA